MRRSRAFSLLLAVSLTLAVGAPAAQAAIITPHSLAVVECPFTDVETGDYFYTPTLWAVSDGVTNGTTPTSFSPDSVCTQSQILTFLWRAADYPETTIANPFAHAGITADQYFYTALLWAYEKGIVTDRALDPNAPCRRSDVVLYLWRLSGSPAPSSPQQFTDVPSNASYAKAVAWATEEGITNGTSPTTFSPASTCTRGQIVTFLYRHFVW